MFCAQCKSIRTHHIIWHGHIMHACILAVHHIDLCAHIQCCSLLVYTEVANHSTLSCTCHCVCACMSSFKQLYTCMHAHACSRMFMHAHACTCTCTASCAKGCTWSMCSCVCVCVLCCACSGFVAADLCCSWCCGCLRLSLDVCLLVWVGWLAHREDQFNNALNRQTPSNNH